MDNNLFQRLKELIDKNQNFGIVVSPNPTFDGMAAGLGMYLSLVQMKKNVTIVCPTDLTVEVSSLVGVDKVQKSFGGSVSQSVGQAPAVAGSDMVVSFPYKEGEIEKVSYDVDNGKLRIVVKAGPQGLSFTPNDVQFQQGQGQVAQAAPVMTSGAMPNVLIFVGVGDMQNLGYQKQVGVTVVNFDNRSNNTKYGDIVHVDSRFSSLSEEVADFLTLLEPQIELDKDTSQNLLSGILSATNNFENNGGSYLAFEMAGILMKKGAVRKMSGAYAKPQTTAMPTENYFPPQQPAGQSPLGGVQVAQPQPIPQAPVMPVQQPVQQYNPMPQPMVQQPVQQQYAQPAPVMQQQPVQVQQPIAQPIQSMQQPGTMQSPASPVQQAPQEQPPADWLTPKVYNGSTVL